MTDSDSEWGELASFDSELADTWDGFDRLPDAGTHDVLDAFVASKRITVDALVRLGARLAGPTTLAFAFPGGLKYRDMETGRKWSYAGSEWLALKIVKAAAGQADTVLVCEGETDAARLTLLYPDCDVAPLPAGARTIKQAYVDQLREYPLVLTALDSDVAGDAGAALIAEHVPQAVRFAPPAKDWCALEADPPPLPDPPALTTAAPIGGIVFTDIAAMVEEGVPDPDVLVEDLLYTEGVHLFSAHPGQGKTVLVSHLALSVLIDNEEWHVVWLDYESGEQQTARRLMAMDAPLELLKDRFHYAPWPTESEKYLDAVAERWPKTLVVLDSMSKALAQGDIDENDNSEVTKWTTQIVRACKMRRIPIVIIDHITKDGDKSSYSRGAGAKLADVDVHWRVKQDEPFNRTTKGILSARQLKDREGYFPFILYWEVGDGNGGLTLLPTDSPEPPADTKEDPNAPAI